MIDYLIKDASIIDGTGKASFMGDIAIEGNKISAIGRLGGAEAGNIIQAGGKIATPGFIDMHSHSDVMLMNGEPVNHKLLQGITTELIGQDGMSVAPLTESSKEHMAKTLEPLAGKSQAPWVAWEMDKFLDSLEQGKPHLNVMTLTGHCNLRMAAMGHRMGTANASELSHMRSMLARSLEQGSFGLSLGLIYPPSSYSDTKELISLGEVVGHYGGIVVSHMRDEQEGIFEALDEMIAMGLQGNARIHISHLKCLGRKNWGRMPEVLAKIEAAREQGVRISFDQYPYDASSTSLSALVPGEALEGGWEAFSQRMKDPAYLPGLLQGIAKNMESRGGAESVKVASAQCDGAGEFVGKSLAQVARLWSCTPEEAALEIIGRSRMGAIAIYHAMSPEDVELAMRHPLHTVGSDGVLGAFPHPRAYGTFSRILCHYQAERELFTLERAVGDMTSKPAKVMGLEDRGRLGPGFHADVVLFDPLKLKDCAGYESPANSPEGFEWVFVNGVPLLADGHLREDRAGVVLRH